MPTQDFKGTINGMYGADHPAFLMGASASQDNVTGDGTAYTVLWDEIFDLGGDFAANTFTAPVTGKYHFDVHVETTGVLTANTLFSLELVTTNGTFTARKYVIATDSNIVGNDISVLADMDIGETAFVRMTVTNGNKVVDISASRTYSWFSGHLVC